LEEETVVPFPSGRAQLPLHVRSTLVASSIRSLRERGAFDRYAAVLEQPWKNTILESVAGVWLPLEAGAAHYRACDAVGFSVADQLAIGREVGARIQGTFLGTMIRAAKGVGATPWVGFQSTHKLYSRLFDGGGCRVMKLGPKDARLEIAGNPLVQVAYFRNAMRGLWQVAVELFCEKAYVTEVALGDTDYQVKVSWA
jgi:hypothetical protein